MDQQKPKRYCCGTIMRLKEKCLRFHDNDEKMCIDFIKGHEECKVIKRAYQSQWRREEEAEKEE